MKRAKAAYDKNKIINAKHPTVSAQAQGFLASRDLSLGRISEPVSPSRLPCVLPDTWARSYQVVCAL